MIDYSKITDFMLESGKRLVKKAGSVKDIGISKKDLTEEDLSIERGLKEIVESFGPEHVFYAEEESSVFSSAKSIWVVDPISGTANFIKGLPYYSIVLCHLIDGKPVFSAIHNPSTNELFTAKTGEGAFLNGKPICVSEKQKNIILRISSKWKDESFASDLTAKLVDFKVEVSNTSISAAINYCLVASGRVDGIISLTKDTFPEFAGCHLIQEAGGRFTNINGEDIISPNDRVFVGGNQGIYSKLFPIVKSITPPQVL